MDSIIYAYYIEGKHLEMHCLRPCICIALIRIIYGGYIPKIDFFCEKGNLNIFCMTQQRNVCIKPKFWMRDTFNPLL